MSQNMIAAEKLFLVGDKTALVREGDARAAFLYATEGDEIPADAAEMFGLIDGKLPADDDMEAVFQAEIAAKAAQAKAEAEAAEKEAAEKAWALAEQVEQQKAVTAAAEAAEKDAAEAAAKAEAEAAEKEAAEAAAKAAAETKPAAAPETKPAAPAKRKGAAQ